MLFPEGDAKIKAQFDKSVNDQHLVYYYDAKNPDTGAAEKWKYEMHFYSDDRINYKIHGGPMAGRVNYQKADYQMIREDIWQCNWLEETGTVCSLVWDMTNKRITTLLNFSKGHWEQAEAAHGDKRDPEALKRWRKLAEVGKSQAERFVLNEQADIAEHFQGKGELQDVDLKAPCL